MCLYRLSIWSEFHWTAVNDEIQVWGKQLKLTIIINRPSDRVWNKMKNNVEIFSNIIMRKNVLIMWKKKHAWLCRNFNQLWLAHFKQRVERWCCSNTCNAKWYQNIADVHVTLKVGEIITASKWYMLLLSLHVNLYLVITIEGFSNWT